MMSPNQVSQTSNVQSTSNTQASGAQSTSQTPGAVTVSGTYEWDASYGPGFVYFDVSTQDSAKLLSLGTGGQSKFCFSNTAFARQALAGDQGSATVVVKNYQPGKPDTGSCNKVELVSVVQ